MAETTVAKILLRKGTESQRTAVTFTEGEPAFETGNKQLYIGDGATPGGWKIGGQGGTMGYTELSANSIKPYNPSTNKITLSASEIFLNTSSIDGRIGDPNSSTRIIYADEFNRLDTRADTGAFFGGRWATKYRGGYLRLESSPALQEYHGDGDTTMLRTAIGNASADNTGYGNSDSMWHTIMTSCSSDPTVDDTQKHVFNIRGDGFTQMGIYPIWDSATATGFQTYIKTSFYSQRHDQQMHWTGSIRCDDFIWGNNVYQQNCGYGRRNTNGYNSILSGNTANAGSGILQTNYYQESADGNGIRRFWLARNIGDQGAYYSGTHTAGFKFLFLSGGDAYCDGAWNAGGADYAEMFEWSDGAGISAQDAEERTGKTVVINKDGKIELSTSSSNPADIIGIVSINSSIIGNNPANWPSTYKTDPFGRVVKKSKKFIKVKITEQDTDNPIPTATKETFVDCDPKKIPENGEPVGKPFTAQVPTVNTKYDSSLEYIPRKDRPEWASVGMLGKLPVYKDQVKGDRWIKIRDINKDVEEWLIR